LSDADGPNSAGVVIVVAGFEVALVADNDDDVRVVWVIVGLVAVPNKEDTVTNRFGLRGGNDLQPNSLSPPPRTNCATTELLLAVFLPVVLVPALQVVVNHDRRDKEDDDPEEEKQKTDFSHDNNNNAAVVDKVLVRPYIPNNIVLAVRP
jgi:hypothetical protein